MKKMTDEEKIEKIKKLYDEFHSKILVLMEKQSELLERSIKLADEKKLEEVRNKIKKSWK
jgi:CO dehydrogenase/acetyl-CoA synthase epsilon subunit